MSGPRPNTTLIDRGVAELAGHLMKLVLRPREIILKHQAAKSKYVQQLIRDCRRDKAKPMHMLSAIAFEDVTDTRIPIGEITRPFRDLIELLEQRRKEVETQGIDAPTLLPVMLREQRAQAALDEAQLRVADRPDDPELIDAALRRSAEYDEAQRAMVSALEQRLAAIRSRASKAGA